VQIILRYRERPFQNLKAIIITFLKWRDIQPIKDYYTHICCNPPSSHLYPFLWIGGKAASLVRGICRCCSSTGKTGSRYIRVLRINGRSLKNPEASWHGSSTTLLASIQYIMWSRFMCLVGVRVQTAYVLQAHSHIAWQRGKSVGIECRRTDRDARESQGRFCLRLIHVIRSRSGNADLPRFTIATAQFNQTP
jgi:hypothetical protein